MGNERIFAPALLFLVAACGGEAFLPQATSIGDGAPSGTDGGSDPPSLLDGAVSTLDAPTGFDIDGRADSSDGGADIQIRPDAGANADADPDGDETATDAPAIVSCVTGLPYCPGPWHRDGGTAIAKCCIDYECGYSLYIGSPCVPGQPF